MSAVLRDERSLAPLAPSDLDAVLAIENLAYDHPWSRGNFIDSLAAGYWSQALTDVCRVPRLLGYLIAMPGVDEVHLLNLTVNPVHQHRGHARWMLDALVDYCRDRRASRLWLEVRASNQRARALYGRYGFREAGLRKGYYPASLNGREDAVVMSMSVAGGMHALG